MGRVQADKMGRVAGSRCEQALPFCGGVRRRFSFRTIFFLLSIGLSTAMLQGMGADDSVSNSPGKTNLRVRENPDAPRSPSKDTERPAAAADVEASELSNGEQREEKDVKASESSEGEPQESAKTEESSSLKKEQEESKSANASDLPEDEKPQVWAQRYVAPSEAPQGNEQQGLESADAPSSTDRGERPEAEGAEAASSEQKKIDAASVSLDDQEQVQEQKIDAESGSLDDQEQVQEQKIDAESGSLDDQEQVQEQRSDAAAGSPDEQGQKQVAEEEDRSNPSEGEEQQGETGGADEASTSEEEGKGLGAAITEMMETVETSPSGAKTQSMENGDALSPSKPKEPEGLGFGKSILLITVFSFFLAVISFMILDNDRAAVQRRRRRIV